MLFCTPASLPRPHPTPLNPKSAIKQLLDYENHIISSSSQDPLPKGLKCSSQVGNMPNRGFKIPCVGYNAKYKHWLL